MKFRRVVKVANSAEIFGAKRCASTIRFVLKPTDARLHRSTENRSVYCSTAGLNSRTKSVRLARKRVWVNFSPLLNTLKAILITIIALSSLSTYLYSEYLVFGENIGFLIDVLTVTSWQLVIPLGVMGIWTLMSELRVYIIIFVLLASVVLHLVSDRKEDAR